MEIIATPDNEWVASHHKIEGERMDVTPVPNPLGYYYYPVSMPHIDAFLALRRVMIAAHKDKINRLMQSLDKLEWLDLP